MLLEDIYRRGDIPFLDQSGNSQQRGGGALNSQVTCTIPTYPRYM